MSPTHRATVEVLGPWSLETSRNFWEAFTPASLPTGPDTQDASVQLSTVFRAEHDWQPVQARVIQRDDVAEIEVRGEGDLEPAVLQVARFLSLDVDARPWPQVAERDAVIADAQAHLPGLRPCGFHSPYEAAAWSVLAQRVRITQAARLRADLIDRLGDHGAFPSPSVLREADVELPGRKAEYLRAVAEAALDGLLDGAALRAIDPDEAMTRVEAVKGLGPFAAELVVLRGANAPDAVPRHERRLEAEIVERYGSGASLAEIAENWRPLRTWASVHLRALREQRTAEIGGPS